MLTNSPGGDDVQEVALWKVEITRPDGASISVGISEDEAKRLILTWFIWDKEKFNGTPD